MHKKFKTRTGLAVLAIASISGGSWGASTVSASDHNEAPLVKEDAAQDITDLYVFKSGANKTTIIVCWAGFNDSRKQPDDRAVYDPNALYTIHVDNNNDNKADLKFYWRYGLNAQEQYGVQWENIPGADGPVSGPVETVFDVGPFARAWTGHADDPFFFDAGGYLMTLTAKAPMFDPSRDFLAGFNVTAAAIEMDTDVLAPGKIQVWVTSSRKG